MATKAHPFQDLLDREKYYARKSCADWTLRPRPDGSGVKQAVCLCGHVLMRLQGTDTDAQEAFETHQWQQELSDLYEEWT